MGKSSQKKRSSQAVALADNHRANESVPEAVSTFGRPHVTATLALEGSDSVRVSDGRVGLPADALYEARLAAGELVAVAVSAGVPPASPLPPGLAPSSVITAERTQTPDNLWDNLAGSCRGDRLIQPHPGISVNAYGAYFMLATIWPVKVATGTAVLSPGLLASCGSLNGRTGLLVYKIQQERLGGEDSATKQLCLSLCMDGDGQAAVLPPKPKPQASQSSSSSPAKTPTKSPGQSAVNTKPLMSVLPSSSAWLVRILGGDSPRQKALLELSAARHLQGRQLLAGNPVVLPILGRQHVFVVAPNQQDGGVGPANANAAHKWVILRVDRHTQVHLSTGAEEDPQNAVGGAEHSEVDSVTRAAEAAATAVGGGKEGPAARAASRAAQGGLDALAGSSLRQLGGLGPQIAALRQLVALPLKAPGVFARYGVQAPRGVLLWGPPGSGKTRLAAAIAADCGAALFVVNGSDVVSAYYGHSEAGLRGVFAAAKAAAPAIIFIDEVDALAPAREGGSAPSGAPTPNTGAMTSASARLVTTLLTEMNELGDAQTGTMPSGTSCSVVVIAATNRPDALDAALRRPGRFDQELEVGLPSPTARADILRTNLTGIKHSLAEAEVQTLAAAAHGFVGADLSALCEEAALAALRRCISLPPSSRNLEVTLEDFKAAETRVRPSAMREVALEVPNVRWEDVGGLDGVKQRLQEAVQWPQQHVAALSRLGAKAPSGVLLYGPPGCSKTLLARAVAAEAKLNFLAVKGPELFSKYVGDSEKAVASLFARARAAAPAIVFFDEIDGLAAKRSEIDEGNSGVGNRVLSQLLMEMDGLQARANVVVIAATNRPDCVDSALLRPGRFDRLLFVPPPDEAARLAILRVHTRRTPLAADVDLAKLAAASAGYTGADITALVREAALAALQEDISAFQVSSSHFTAALKAVQQAAPLTVEALAIHESFHRQGR